MAAVSRPLNGRMAETGPIKTGAQKEERKALAKIAALGALLTRQAGGFLALSCPTDEARGVRPRTWRYAIAHCMRDKVHGINSWQSSRTCPVLMLLVLRMR